MVCSRTVNEVNFYIDISTSVLSILGSLFIMFLTCFSNVFENLTSKILTLISINDLIRSIVILVPLFYRNSILCNMFAYISNVTYTSNVIWAAYICLSLYKAIIKNDSDSDHLRQWVILTYPMLLILDALPFITQSFARVNGLCTLKLDFIGQAWRLGLVYIPEWILSIYSIVVLINLYKELKTVNSVNVKKLIIDGGSIYAIIILVSLIPMTVLRILELFKYDCDVIFFSEFTEVLFSLNGFFNTIPILLNKNVRRAIREKYYKRFSTFDATQMFMNPGLIN